MQQVSNREMVRIANATIVPANKKDLTKYRNGDTGDIIQETLDCYRDCVNDVKAFAPNLKSNNLVNTCRNVWQFVKYNIAYKMDPKGVQWVRTPARLWNDKEGDCKSYAVTTACLLHQLGVNGILRFVSFNPFNPTPTHVYVVVPTPQGEIKIDAVLNSFNIEKPFFYKQDYAMTQISRLSGVAGVVDNDAAIKRLVFEREVERSRGTLTLQRATMYNNLISSLKSGASIGDVVTDVSNLATSVSNPLSLAQSVLSSLLSLFPGHSNWYKWDTAWRNGDFNQVVNLTAVLYTQPDQNSSNQAGFTGDMGGAVSDQLPQYQGQPRYKLLPLLYQKTGSPAMLSIIKDAMAKNLLTAAEIPTDVQAALNPAIKTVNPPNNNTQAGMNMWVTLGIAGAALYFITKK